MPDLDLAETFFALTGQRPFAWQRRLYDELSAGVLPDAVDMPTGLGKTKVMALWLIAVGCGAKLPRRLVYVVDRRAVVDQATEEAQRLALRLQGFLSNESSRQAAWRSNLGLSNGGELPVSTLRGQFVDNRRWLSNPASAALIVGTIDMIGSRLLFGGYGVSSGMRPAHAGLLGADALIVLDEAHLVPPFQALLRQVAEQTAQDRGQAPAQIVPEFRLMALSATGRILGGAKIFRLAAEDVADAQAGKRLVAEKRLRLLPEVPVRFLADELANRAWQLAEDGAAVLVFCNSRKTAQEVDKTLRKPPRNAEHVALLVGERRLRERERLTNRNTPEGAVMARFDPERHRKSEGEIFDGPAFIVATSAGEVGIDLDADHMVCDLVAWERMVQRFGRVNRRPEPGSACIEVIPTIIERKKDKEAEDEVGKERLQTLLAPFNSPHWQRHPDGTLDASPLSLRQLKDSPLAVTLQSAETEEPLRPPLNRPLIEAFSLTSVGEHSGRPKVEPWLRGWVDKDLQTAVAWRALLPLRGIANGGFADDEATRKRELTAFFEVAPPHLTELIEAPTWRVAEVLRKRSEAWRKRWPATEEPHRRHPPLVVALNRRNEVEDTFPIERIIESNKDRLEYLWAERTLVVDARLGGLDVNGLLDSSASAPPPSVDGEDWGMPLESTARRRICWGKRTTATGNWRFERYLWHLDPEGEEGPQLWVEVWRGDDGDPTIGDPAISRRSQSLQEHHQLAGEAAADIAEALELPEPYRRMLVRAAEWHDAGKDRALWQNAMAPRDPREGRPYAKTTGGGDGRRLNDYRHEFGTLGDLEANGALADLDEHLRELALHLIAAHHGRARPAIAPYDPGRPGRWETRAAQEARARQAALRFARLQRRWGPWGLAWWEALLRAADWRASARHDEAAAPQAIAGQEEAA